MWPFSRKTGRRREAARARAESRTRRLNELRRAGWLTASWVGLVFAGAATLILLLGGRGMPHQLGDRLEQPHLARVGFDGPDPHDPGQTRRFAPGEPVAFEFVDEDDFVRLRAEHAAFLAAAGWPALLWHILGLAGLTLLVTVGLGAYIGRFQPRVLRLPGQTVVLGLILLAVLLSCRLASLAAWQAWLQVFVAATTTVVAAMVLSIAFNQRFALGTISLLALLIVPVSGQEPLLLLVLLAGVMTGVLGLNEIRTRSKLPLVGLASAGALALAATAAGLLAGQGVWYVLWKALAAGGAGLAAGLITQGLLPAVERAFGIATAMTLLEFSDVSKPLLRRLAMEAPGTFNHSLLLGTMAEAAADAIGANGLLARVGAYYHDIGKIDKPAYFVENQEGSFSRHARLSPAMSLLIILGHVKDGLELAREYDLPRVILPFITEHHGTTLVEYFYHAAARQSGDEEPPSETQFRYPGPKPRSRETAILMLCDSVEGATRALAEPTPSRIEDLVREISRKRLHDGQLDECNLTLRELHLVEQSLTRSLCGFYHGRIAYPSSPTRESANGRTA